MEKRFIGIDLHKATFTVAIKEGEKIQLYQFNFDLEGIENFKSKLTVSDYVAIESSTQSFYLYDQIASLVKKCVIVNTRKFKVVSESTSKTDKNDAKILAKYCSYEDLLPEVYVPDHNIRKLRMLFSTYNLTKKQSNQTANRIYSVLLLNGISLDHDFIYDKNNREAIFNLEIDTEYKNVIKKLFDKFDYLENEKKELTYEIFKFGKLYQKEMNLLTSISGISILIALSLISDIADIKRFKNAKSLCSYLGVVPKVDNSGDTNHHGSIHRNSRKNSRSLLTQVIKHLSNNSEHLQSFYLRKKKAKGSGKARVALMRKIIVIIYNMLLKEEYCFYRVESKHNRKLREFEAYIKKHEKKEICKKTA